MAAAMILLTKVPLNNGVAMPAFTAIDAADGALIDFTAQDTKIVVLVQNTSTSAAGTVTFKAGSGIQGAADLAVSIPASATQAFVLESGAFQSAGKVKATGPATLKLAALRLP